MSLFAAMLNATGRFFAAAFAPILLNLVLIGAMGLAVAHRGAPLDYIVWGVALAGFVQFAFVFIAAWRARLRVALVAPKITPEVKSVWLLAVPGILAAGIGQINLLVGTSIATGQAGAAAWLYYADRLYQLPMGVIGVAMSVALLPELSRRLAANQVQQAHEAQSTAVLAAGFLTLPAAAGLFVLAEPIISLLFERGAFTRQDTAITAQLLQAFCLGLPAFVFIKALQPSFFARQDTRAPFIDGAIGVAVNVSLSLSLFPIYGAIAIALATVAAGYVTLTLMLVRLAKRDVWHFRGLVLARLLAQSLAAALMAGALLQAMQVAPLPEQNLAIWLASLIGLGGLVFFLSALVLGGVPRQTVFDALARLRRRQR
jgi:putative peptidoglycan lipid II flippase